LPVVTTNPQWWKAYRPEKVFLVIAIFFGFLYLFVTPPFQVPDEPYHFLCAWKNAEGQVFLEKKDGIVGAYFPDGLVKVAMSTSHLRWKPDEKITVDEILSLFELPLGQQKTFVPMGSAGYSPVPYLPQTAAILLAKPFGLRPLPLMYWVRIVNLLAWAGIIYAAIRITPIYPVLFMLLALTPMSLYEAASLSADAMTNGLALLTLCLVLRFAMNADSILPGKSIAGLMFLIVSLSLCKNVYFLFVFLFLLIPIRRFGSARRYAVLFGIAVLLAFLVTAGWSAVVAQSPALWRPETNPSSKIASILNQPLAYAHLLFNSIWGLKWLMYKSFVGWFGWTDVLLGKWHTRSWMLLLVVFALAENRRDCQFTWSKKILCGLLFAVQIILIYTLLYLFWTPIDSAEIKGLQGRYFIPIAPLALLLLYNTKFRLPFKTPALWAGLCTIISLTCAAYVIAVRFYG
jgi:uncharacterized membrane protein